MMTTRLPRLFLHLTGALALAMLVASPAATQSFVGPSAELDLSDEPLLLTSGDGSGMVISPADDPAIRFIELAGAEVAARLTPIDRMGRDLGSGRVIVLGASERRDVRLRDELTSEALAGVRLRVEILQGRGRLLVSPLGEAGNGLRLEPSATRGRPRTVTRPAAKPTSVVLIDSAEASGALTSETALLYRVYAFFGDARLPAQYRGDDSTLEDSLYLAEVRERFATLTAATQAAVLPFLTPPAYQGSWANVAGSGPGTMDTPPPCQFFSDKWSRVDTSDFRVRVWYRADVAADGAHARELVNVIEATIWPSLSGLMKGHLPKSDLIETCNGGSQGLDIFLVDAVRSFTVPFSGCSNVPVFILLGRTSPNALATHEIFHAFQFSYPLAGCISSANYKWWAEASAEWSQDFVFPGDQREWISAPSLLEAPEKSLDLHNDPHWYGAYLLPFFVYESSWNADFVRVSWEKCASQPALEALDQALPGGFEAVWPEFAKANWNRDPIDDYKRWDGLQAGAHPAGGSSLQVGATPDNRIELKLGLPRLSATYKHFIFEDTARSVAFWNGVTTNLVLRERPFVGGHTYEHDPASPEQTKGAKVTALIKIGGQWTTEDWTALPYRTYCRDMTAERIEELVLIISNSDFKTRDRKLEAPGLQPVLWASNMGCWQWKGTAHYDDGGLTVDTTVTWKRNEIAQTMPIIGYQGEGTVSWRVNVAECSGAGTFPISGLAVMSTYNFITSAGSFHRSYVAAGAAGQMVSLTCGNATMPYAINAWLEFPLQPLYPDLPRARFVKVDASGSVMDDSHIAFPGAPPRWAWHFTSQRQ